MCTKGFKVVINLDVHAVTCPGVWLCPNGKVRLKVNVLGFTSKTQCLPPAFPLLYHEQFVFEKLISTCRQLVDLQKYFEEQIVFLELVQKSGSIVTDEVILATFEIALFDLLYPSNSRRGVLAGVDIDLLMEPTCHFPGIIAPKVEVSTKTTVEEINITSPKSMKGYINPKTLRSKSAQKQNEPSMKPKLAQQGHCNVFYHGHSLCHCYLWENVRPPFVVPNKNDCGTLRPSDIIPTIPVLPALPCRRWGGKKLICRHFKDADWHRKQVSKERENTSNLEHSCHLQRPASLEAIKNDNCKCVISHRSGYCAVCNLYKKYFPEDEMDGSDPPKYNCKSSLDSKSCEQIHPGETKQHYTDYTSRSRLTSELSRRVRHATNRVDYPFLQRDKDMCRCCMLSCKICEQL